MNILPQYSPFVGIEPTTTWLKATRSTKLAKMPGHNLCLNLAHQPGLTTMNLTLQPQYSPIRFVNVNLDY